MKKEKVLENVGKFTIALPFTVIAVYFILIYGVFTTGYIVSIMWTWFAPEPIKYLFADFWAVASFVYLARVILPNESVKDKDESIWLRIAIGLSKPWIILFGGWLIHNKFFIW